MSSTHAVQPSTSTLRTGLGKAAVARVRDVLQRLGQRLAHRLIVPVSSTDEMNEVWKLYRLIPDAERTVKISEC